VMAAADLLPALPHNPGPGASRHGCGRRDRCGAAPPRRALLCRRSCARPSRRHPCSSAHTLLQWTKTPPRDTGPASAGSHVRLTSPPRRRCPGPPVRGRPPSAADGPPSAGTEGPRTAPTDPPDGAARPPHIQRSPRIVTAVVLRHTYRAVPTRGTSYE
jgi:hypothetical protein